MLDDFMVRAALAGIGVAIAAWTRCLVCSRIRRSLSGLLRCLSSRAYGLI